jgi:adenine-specific DNA-methyltransferase
MKAELTDNYRGLVGLEHRQRFGQYFSPEAVASFMCRWAIGNKPRVLCDPAFGLGAFHAGALSLGSPASFVGYEIDPIILRYYHSSNLAGEAPSISNADYLKAWGRKYDAIVCNPPYMRFQNFAGRDEVFSLFQQHLGVRLSGYTNSASAFLLKSLSELEPGGRLAYIMPLEFLNAGYGAEVKRQLLHKSQLKALIRIEAEREVFPDAITSVGIILVSNDGMSTPVKFYSLSNLCELSSVLESTPQTSMPACDISPSDKWLKFFESSPCVVDQTNLVCIREFGAFSRGIATGANEFFILSRSKAIDLGIPENAISRCVARSSQVKTPVFSNRELRQLEDDDAEVLLLDVNGESSGSVRDYIRLGEEQGFHKRYLTKMRRPWYKVEHRTPAPLLFGVFSRDKFKAIRNYTSAVNLTCFHGFYPTMFGNAYIDRLFLYFNSQAARRILSMSMRRYGDGLDKFEPNDLNQGLAPSFSWFDGLPTEMVQNAIKKVAVGEELPSYLENRFSELVSDS